MLIQMVGAIVLDCGLILSFSQTPASTTDLANAAELKLQRPNAADILLNKGAKAVTIKQLRADPKRYAQKNVTVAGEIGEVSSAEHYFELIQGGEPLRVLLDSLSPGVEQSVYSAKAGSRVTVQGMFSGYVLYASGVKIHR